MVDYSIVVPTLNGGKFWQDCIYGIREQNKTPKEVIVIDSSSTDETVEIAKNNYCNVIIIKPEDFNHGQTRSFAANQLKTVDVVLFLTQDAVIAGPDAMGSLLKHFQDNNVGAVYGKQLPRDTSNIFENHERIFSYPSQSTIYSYDDKDKYGIKTCFLSNAFTAYRLEALKEVGNFPSNTIVSEDMYVGAKMLKAGWNLAYCADAVVIHSHCYNLRELFGRYFDIGVFNARESWIREEFGSADSEGLKYLKSEITMLWHQKPWLIPYALVRTIVKFLGFKLGLIEKYVPLSIKRGISRQKHYWR